MQLRPGTLALTATLAFLTSLLPLSTDMYLPSLPAIARGFEVAPADAQATLSMFLLGMVGGQVFYGPISDGLGRRPALFVGMAVFTGASLLCAFAPSIGWLIAARFLQALGAAAPIVIGRAIVRDLYAGPAAGRELSRMGAIMGLVPMLAPVIGGVTQQALGWRAIFIITAALAAGLTIFVWRALPETNRAEVKSWPGLGAMGREYAIVFRSPAYRAYVGMLVASHAGLFAFLSTATFILQGRYGLTPMQFGFGLGLTGFGYVSGAFTAQRIVTRLGLDGVIRAGVLCQLTAGALATALMLADAPSALIVILPTALYTFGHRLVQPQTQAGSALPHPDRAGAAASLAGIFQLGFASLYGFCLASLLSLTPFVLPVGLLLAGLAATTIFFSTAGIRAAGK